MEELGQFLLGDIGAVAGCIVVVVLFLRHIRESSARLTELARQCHAYQAASQAAFSQSLDRIVEATEKNTDRIMTRLNELTR